MRKLLALTLVTLGLGASALSQTSTDTQAVGGTTWTVQLIRVGQENWPIQATCRHANRQLRLVLGDDPNRILDPSWPNCPSCKLGPLVPVQVSVTAQCIGWHESEIRHVYELLELHQYADGPHQEVWNVRFARVHDQ